MTVHPEMSERLDAWQALTAIKRPAPEVMISLDKYMDLHRRVGFAQGAFEALLVGWDIPEDLRLVIRDCLERLEEPA